MATEVTKLLYIVVVDEEEEEEEEKRDQGEDSFRYTRSVLQSTLQLIGCKPRHAFKMSRTVFDKIRNECMGAKLVSADRAQLGEDNSNGLHHKESSAFMNAFMDKGNNQSENSIPFELYKRRTTVIVKRETFLDVVCDALTEYKYMGPNQRADLMLACRIRERKESVTVLLCGTSGCGKSTLSALLGSRLGITTVVSTDSIRHMMRSFVDEKQNPLLWASTYHAGEYLDPVAVSEAKAKKRAKKLAGISTPPIQKGVKSPPERISNAVDLISSREMAVEGFKAQSEMVIDSLDRLITAWEDRKESVVVEGVHLSLNFVMGLMKKHPSVIPFMVFIANEEKHLERFAVRAKYMTLDPAKNKYVKYIRNIRTIQEYLCNRADKHLVPKINNTNVDKSVAAIHATVFGCLRRREAGEQLYDPMTNTAVVIDEEYRNQCAANCVSSKGMFQLIQRKGSSRHLMALLNNDGSVAKAWPVYTLGNDGKPTMDHFTANGGIGTPMYGPLQIGKAEPINLQFGHFGISAWPSDAGGTSHASSVDESRGELTDNGSRYYSSCCSSPRLPEGHAKELKEEQSVHGSDDEEGDEPLERDSDEDLSDDGSKRVDEEEGSVDEESTKTDEEYDDLAMLDIQEDGYTTDVNEEIHNKSELSTKVVPVSGDQLTEGFETYRKSIDQSFRSKSAVILEPPLGSYTSFLKEKNEKRVPTSGNIRVKKRSNSIPTLGKHGALLTGSTIPEGMSR